ncbi:MAG: hypothetical protein WDN07_00790 [Actinomycetota bacterium]
MTTGGFTSEQLELEEQILVLPHLDIRDAVAIGEIAAELAKRESLAISIEIRLGDWTVFHIALPGAKPDQPSVDCAQSSCGFSYWSLNNA